MGTGTDPSSFRGLILPICFPASKCSWKPVPGGVFTPGDAQKRQAWGFVSSSLYTATSLPAHSWRTRLLPVQVASTFLRSRKQGIFYLVCSSSLRHQHAGGLVK